MYVWVSCSPIKRTVQWRTAAWCWILRTAHRQRVQHLYREKQEKRNESSGQATGRIMLQLRKPTWAQPDVWDFLPGPCSLVWIRPHCWCLWKSRFWPPVAEHQEYSQEEESYDRLTENLEKKQESNKFLTHFHSLNRMESGRWRCVIEK